MWTCTRNIPYLIIHESVCLLVVIIVFYLFSVTLVLSGEQSKTVGWRKTIGKKKNNQQPNSNQTNTTEKTTDWATRFYVKVGDSNALEVKQLKCCPMNWISFFKVCVFAFLKGISIVTCRSVNIKCLFLLGLGGCVFFFSYEKETKKMACNLLYIVNVFWKKELITGLNDTRMALLLFYLQFKERSFYIEYEGTSF